MPAHGFFRGHKLTWIKNKWVYADTGEDIPANGGKIRPCAKCGAMFSLGESETDPCLGVLPGVDNACCGHGVRSESYIRFETGVVVKDFKIEYTERWEGSE